MRKDVVQLIQKLRSGILKKQTAVSLDLSRLGRRAVEALIAMVLGLLLCLVVPGTITAQPDSEVTSLAVQVNNGQIKLYTVDADGHFSLLQTLTGFHIFNSQGYNDDSTWELPRGSEITPSPDMTRLAFTVMNPRTYKTALLLYQTGQSAFQTIPTPGLGQVIWSPDSSKILLTPPNDFLGGSVNTLRDTYIYDLVSDSFTLLLQDKFSVGAGYQWLPDESQIIYAGSFESCDASPCLSVSNLYSIEPQGQNNRQLTDLATLTPEDLGLPPATYYPCNVAKPTWSAVNERIYFSLECQDSFESPFSSLHSVTLDGEHRIEGRAIDFSPNATRAQILDIHPSPTNNSVYVSTQGSSVELVDNFTNIVGSWRVLRDVASENIVEITFETFGDQSVPPIEVSALSPNSEHMVLAGRTQNDNGYIAVLDLNTGQVMTYQTEEGVCEIEWVDTQSVRYRQFDTACGAYRIPTGIWQLDITTGNPVEITADLPGTVWILPAPEFPPPTSPDTLRLISECSSDPDNSHAWCVENTFTWEVVGTNQTGVSLNEAIRG